MPRPEEQPPATALRGAFEAIYSRLLHCARRLMGHERVDHTLEPSALVHDVYLRLNASSDLVWRDLCHLESLAARTMRHVLIDHAKGRGRGHRPGKLRRITLSEETLPSGKAQAVDVLIVDEALARLASRDASGAAVLELRVFSGMTLREIAAALDISYDTAKDEWAYARAWLANELTP